jgi:hypothetical protein
MVIIHPLNVLAFSYLHGSPRPATRRFDPPRHQGSGNASKKFHKGFLDGGQDSGGELFSVGTMAAILVPVQAATG